MTSDGMYCFGQMMKLPIKYKRLCSSVCTLGQAPLMTFNFIEEHFLF